MNRKKGNRSVFNGPKEALVTQSDGTVNKQRWAILSIAVLFTLMGTLDASIVNVALPVISEKLQISTSAVEWVVTSYLIGIVALLLLFGRLGDLYGKHKVFKTGILVFTLGSFLCGLASSFSVLVLARAVQAIGAAATMSTSQGIITQAFPPNERGRALGMNGTFVALGLMAGPPLGGFILSTFNWEYIFLINVPIGLFAFVLAQKILPKKEAKVEEKLDLKGTLLFIMMIVMLFGSLTRAKEVGFDNPILLVSLAASLVLFVLFIKVESRIQDPMLNLDIFKNKLFSLSILCGFLSFVAINCSNIILPFYLQGVMHLDPAMTGLVLMVSPIILSVVAPMSGYLADKIGPMVPTVVGLLIASIGFFSMTLLDENSSIGLLLIFLVITTLGNAIFQSPNNALIMSTVDKRKLGIAGSVNALVRNLGTICGVTLSTGILYLGMSIKAGSRINSFTAGQENLFVFGMKMVYTTAGMICVTAAILTILRLYRMKKKTND